jgi:ADP-heptose:LPS heptosyltransferase
MKGCKDVKKILLIQLGDIGDVVWMTPTLWAVKDAHPKAELFLLVRQGNGALLVADPSVAGIIEVKKYRAGFFKSLGDQLSFLINFRGECFDMVIDLRADERGAIMARLSGAPVRIAQYYEAVPFWRNRCFNRLVKPPPGSGEEFGAANQSLRVVRELGIEAKTTVPRLWIGEGVKERVTALLKEHEIDGSLLWCSLNPFARWSYKELPGRKWTEIIDWLWQEFHVASVIVGSAAERGRATGIAAACSGRVYNFAGSTSLADLAGLLQLSRLHIGVDSAAPHIAAAVGTPTVTIYGPSDWRDWAPPGDRHRVVLAEGDCAPCHRKGCDNSDVSKCLEDFPVKKIKASLREALTSSGYLRST